MPERERRGEEGGGRVGGIEEGGRLCGRGLRGGGFSGRAEEEEGIGFAEAETGVGWEDFRGGSEVGREWEGG